MRLWIQHMLYFRNMHGKTMNQIFKDLSPVAKGKKKVSLVSWHWVYLSLIPWSCPFLSLSFRSIVRISQAMSLVFLTSLTDLSLAFNTGINNHMGHCFQFQRLLFIYKIILYGILYKLQSARWPQNPAKRAGKNSQHTLGLLQ